MTRSRRLLNFLFWSILFALAYTQAPLYYSNQNQYFLHGAAMASTGELHSDWLSNTASPTPVFDTLVSITLKYGHESLFYAYYALLLGLYFSSLMGIFDYLAGERATPRIRLGFAALLLAVHSAFLRWASYRLFQGDYACYAQGWLAAQYVLGPVFQPSTFGVFLLVAIERFVRGRHFIAFTSIALAGIGHSTYLLPGGILTITFAGILAADGQSRRAISLSLWSLLLVLPTMIDASLNFGPTTLATFAEAQRILVEIRIPHHCEPRQWCDAITWIQIVLMLVGIISTWRTRLFPILAVLFVASAILTVIQMETHSNTLALLFPWRSSVILLPVALAVLLTRLVMSTRNFWESTITKWAGIACIAVLCATGIAIVAFRGGYATNDAEEPLLHFVKGNLQPGDCYLIPFSLPKPQGAKGSVSSDFKPLPDQKTDKRLIPLDFQRFRLVSGAPIHIDFKAIPYRDTEVLEWYRRVNWVQRLYAVKNWNGSNNLAEVKSAGITHVIVANNQDVICDGLIAIYEDENYKVYRVK